jgi:hypothetical protein
MKYDVFHRQSYFVEDVMPAKEMAEYFEERLGWLITSLWELNCKDVDDTLEGVTSRVLKQADVSQEEIRLRAEAIKEIATVFQVCALCCLRWVLLFSLAVLRSVNLLTLKRSTVLLKLEGYCSSLQQILVEGGRSRCHSVIKSLYDFLFCRGAWRLPQFSGSQLPCLFESPFADG